MNLNLYQTVLGFLLGVFSTNESEIKSTHAQNIVALKRQRQVNITRHTIGPKSGHRKYRKYVNERPSRIGHK